MSMNRRTAWMLGVAAAAGAAGAGLALWRQQPQPVLSDAEAEFWASRFEDPDGQPLALERFRGQPLLVNFWATWCPPCVEELPLLNAFYREHQARGWQVVGLAVDQLPAVRSFLQKLPLAFPVGMVGFAGTELSRILGNPGGGLPYTVVFDQSGVVLHQKVGKVSRADLDLWAQLA